LTRGRPLPWQGLQKQKAYATDKVARNARIAEIKSTSSAAFLTAGTPAAPLGPFLASALECASARAVPDYGRLQALLAEACAAPGAPAATTP